MCSNDAKSCYVTILMWRVCMRRMAWKHHRLCVYVYNDSNLHHRSRTVYGDSELTFTGQLWTVPIQGVDKGTGRPANLGSRQHSRSQHVTARRVWGLLDGDHRYYYYSDYAFVDDTDLIITSQNPDDTDADVAIRMQQALTYGRRHSSYRRRNCTGKLVPYRFQAAEQGN
jgi:hypothetical protein